MSPFLGTHQNRLDAKKRVSVPAPFRMVLKEISGNFAMILRPSTRFACIEAWPAASFNALATPLQTMDVFSEEYDDQLTDLYCDAHAVEADKDGRILLPEALAEHARLTAESNVVFMGRGTIFTIWEPAAAAERAADAREKARLRKAAPAKAGLAAE